MPTSRGITKRAFQCGLYEAQDVLVEFDDVDLIVLEPGWRLAERQRWQRRLLYRDVTKKLIFANPGIRPVKLTREYDLFIAVCQNYWDLLYLNAVRGWKERCQTSVVWIDEIWASDVPRFKYWLHVLNEFDHVFVGYRDSVDVVSKALGRQCLWMPGAVDAIRFSPYPEAPARVVDVYSIGRRWDGVHDALRQLAARQEIFYVHDTFAGSDMEPPDHRQHRSMLANTAKRSRYFMVAPAKMDTPGDTAGQIEVGYRYFEGAAAGSIMIGQPANCAAFGELFGWPDAVISINPDGSDVRAVLLELDSQPERVARMSQRNTVESLRRHDWSHRWETLLKTAGFAVSNPMVARQQHLARLSVLGGCALEDPIARKT
jgi:glycosyl transferase family 1